MNMGYVNHLLRRINRIFILLGLSFMFLLSCSQSDDLASKIKLISPKGYVLAGSVDELIAVMDLDNSLEILDIEYLETGLATIGFVSVKDKFGKISTVALGCGQINYEAVSVNVQPILKSTKGQIKVTCSGCDNCRVMGEIRPDGTITVKCESSCCSMTIDSPQFPQN